MATNGETFEKTTAIKTKTKLIIFCFFVYLFLFVSEQFNGLVELPHCLVSRHPVEPMFEQMQFPRWTINYLTFKNIEFKTKQTKKPLAAYAALCHVRWRYPRAQRYISMPTNIYKKTRQFIIIILLLCVYFVFFRNKTFANLLCRIFAGHGASDLFDRARFGVGKVDRRLRFAARSCQHLLHFTFGNIISTTQDIKKNFRKTKKTKTKNLQLVW